VLKIKHFIQQSWLLIVASFVFGMLIALTDSALALRIELNEKKKINDLVFSLIKDANDVEMIIEKASIPANGKTLKTDIYKALDTKGKNIGFAFTAEGSGFADKIKLVIALDAACEKFYGFEVLASNETAYIGSEISEEFFNDQFKDAPVDVLELVRIGNHKIIDREIVTISGATVSSEAVVSIFNNYADKIKEQLKNKGLIQQ
jgi:electron transport complex protein RnfG